MGFCKLVAVVFALATLSHLSHAQNSKDDFVNAHNTARAAVNVGPVTWDDKVAEYAQNYASQRAGDCNMVHSGGQYGENLAAGGGEFSGTDAVNMWVGEKSDYDHASNTCASGKECGHYTQVVWRNSVRIGCARVRCSGGPYSWFVICSYDPPGNYVGQSPY